MSSQPSTTDDATRERLVAYLDGELPPGDSQAVESQLSTDDALRDELQGLDRVWNALDALPRATVDDSFAKSTIEMAVVEAEREMATLTAALPVQRRRRNYAMGLACAGALLFGFLAVRSAMTRNDRLLLEHLPVVYQVDTLEEVGGAEFLRRLAQTAPELLATTDSELVQEQLETWLMLDAGDRPQQRAWVESLSENEKARLLDAARRYARDLTPPRRKAVDATYASLSAAQDRDALLQTALSYQGWLATQSASDQSRLRQMATDDRLKELKRIDQRIANENRQSLAPEDAAALRQAVAKVADSPEVKRLGDDVAERVETMISRWQRAVSGQDRGGSDRGNADRRGPERGGPERGARGERFERYRREAKSRVAQLRNVPAFAVITLGRVAGGREQRLRMLFPKEWETIRSRAAEDWSAIQPQLVAPLSQAAKRRLAKARDDAQRREQLVRWIEQATRQAFEAIDLEAYFASDALTDDERHELLALPTDEMREQLRRKYLQVELGGFDGLMRGGSSRSGDVGERRGERRGDRLRDAPPGRRGGQRGGPPRN